MLQLFTRRSGALALSLVAVLGISACGSKSSSSSSSSSSATTAASTSGGSTSAAGGTITLLQGTAPDYLDPQEGYTTQAAQMDWLAYTGLYTYKHAGGAAGGTVIPGLATGEPKVTDGGKTYTITLRQGLKYSNGTAVKAADFAYTIERAMKINWGGKSFYTGNIVGAAAYDKGSSKKISGITSDDATGTITIHLLQPYGAFLNVLAFPSSGLVPTGTAMKSLTNAPPPGVGPYTIKNVVPNRSYDLVRTPGYTDTTIPGVPAGSVNVDVKIVSSNQTEAEQVLNNQADVFDWADELPPALVPQITAKASDRFKKINTLSTYYFFLNTQTKPFNNQLAREAVNYALDRRALVRLNSGDFTPTCYFLPDGMVGHPTTPCPYGDPTAAPNLAKAKQLVKQSGMEGTPITVWGQTRSPRKEFVDYYTGVLNSIGFKAKSKIIADAQYFPTIGNLKLNPQTGFADWNQDFPNPSDFYLLMDKSSIQQTNNQNFSQVNDPHVQSELAKLNKIPADQLQGAAAEWQSLDSYLAQKAYIASFGQQQVPQFYSSKIDFASAAFNPVYGTDFSTVKLK